MSDTVRVALISGLCTIAAGWGAVWLSRQVDFVNRRRDCEECYRRLLDHHRHTVLRIKIGMANRAGHPEVLEVALAEIAGESEWPNEMREP